ncbi:FixH family protein [Sorangium sp. So ce1036]|uniref:FixH family protein n=1 Tax=Sorangium sp. So ce1036 TaxID=3133328 RepID=UPI003F0F827C
MIERSESQDRSSTSSPSRRRRGALGRVALLGALALAGPGGAALGGAALGGCGGAEGPEEREGATGVIAFEVEPLRPLAEGENAFRVRLSWPGSNDPVEGIALRVSSLMPTMGHASPAEPRVEEVEPGVYEVTNVVFSMPGLWEVRYRAVGADVSDEAAFQYEIR